MFNSIVSFFMSIAIFFYGLFAPAMPEAKPSEEIKELSDICEEFQLSDTVYVIDAGQFSTMDERHLAVSLQGVVAKTQPMIYVRTNHMDNLYLSEMEKAGINISYNDENGKAWSLPALLEKFKSYIADSGYTLYRESEKAEGLNMATNLAVVKGWLPVPESLEYMAKDAGLTMKEDYSDDIYTVIFQWTFFEKYKKHFNDNAICHLQYKVGGLRDLAIQQGFFVFYIDEDVDGNPFRKRVMNYMGDNTPVLGWVKYEVAFVDEASKTGNMAVPSDHSYNNSILASFNCEIPSQKAEKDTYTDPTKHYCALVMSDGDNMQWIQNGYAEYFRKLALDKQFPVTWSFPPLLQDFSPVTVKTVYEAATKDDYFMAGVSGVGYMHPTQFPLDALAGFTDMTASSMEKSGLRYTQILDGTPENELDETKLLTALSYYARYDSIDGGVLSLDPDRYMGGNGRIYFVNDKPFISYRLSLWHPAGEGAEVTDEWLSEQADIVNSYPADISSINGYSVINIHPWTVSIENLAYFVSLLDDSIVLVTVEELMDMINTNIPHTNATIN